VEFTVILFLLLFILGTIVGSFLNVAILRYNTGLSMVRGRSVCFSCGKTLRWWELVPLMSYLVLRGRCSGCRSGISVQYPSVEVATGALFVGAGYLSQLFNLNGSPLYFAFLAIEFALLVVIAVYDMRHKIIPDELAYSFAGLALLWVIGNAISGTQTMYGSIIHILAGPFLALPFYLFWRLSKGRLMGLGDAKLILGLGFFLGLLKGLSAILIAFWVATAFALFFMALGLVGRRFPSLARALGPLGRLHMKSEVPFGPFLIAGALFVLFTGIEVLNFSGF
jgi:leader peptidase (prepilin peptidase)/N-methyltransferase